MKVLFFIQGEGDHNAKLGITILGKTQSAHGLPQESCDNMLCACGLVPMIELTHYLYF
jgi:hypothetical protein